MASRDIPSQRASNTIDIPTLRRQLDEIERNQKDNITGVFDLHEIQKQCDQLQNESIERLSITAQRQLHAYDRLHLVMKRTKEIDEVIKALKEAESVDVCFLMDCTNSMRKYIDDVKNYIFETIEVLKSRFPHLNLRLAFVGYRDLNLPIGEQFSILDFTDEQQFHAFVSMVQCAYGGDFCEDVLGGLQKTIDLNWKQPVRILIHTGDAPSHGNRYHAFTEKADYYWTHDSDFTFFSFFFCIKRLEKTEVISLLDVL